jgi:hypothetical protein
MALKFVHYSLRLVIHGSILLPSMQLTANPAMRCQGNKILFDSTMLMIILFTTYQRLARQHRIIHTEVTAIATTTAAEEPIT